MSMLIGQVVGAKGNEPAIGTGRMDVTVFQTFQVKIPGILERHARNAKGVRLRAGQKHIPLAQARPADRTKLNHIAGHGR
jgi:hypothetical protein